MSDTTSRKYIKTKFEGVYYRLSSKRDPRTGEPDRIYSFWYSDVKNKGHWKTVGRHSEGVRPSTVRRERAKFLIEIANTGASPIDSEKLTLGRAIEDYYTWGQSEGKFLINSYSLYNFHVRSLLHTMPISDIKPNFLSNIKAQLLNTPVSRGKSKRKIKVKNPETKMLSGQTVNHIFGFMRAAVNRAIGTGMWKGHNPFSSKGGVWKLVQVNNTRLRFLTKDEAKMLLADLELRHPPLHDMVLLSLKTGLRPTEMFKLKGQDIDAHANMLYITAKGGKRMPMRIPQDMIAMLMAYNRKPAEHIFQTPRTKRAYSETPQAFRAAIKALKLSPEDGDTLYTVTLHTMRHTFASWLAQSGKVSIMELQKLLRHKRITMTMRYAHLIPGQESEKLAIIDEILT